MPHNATEKEEKEALTPQQIAALERLLAGETVTAVAEAVKADRSTIHRWLRENFEFQAALNRGKRELSHAVQAKLLVLLHKATRTVENAIDQGDLAASLAVLKGMGAFSGTPVTPGLEDPEALRQAAKLAQEEAQLVEAEAKNSRLMRKLVVG